MKNKDFEYTGLKIKDEVVSAKVNELARKDLIAFVKNCPPDYKTKSLVWDPDFIAEMSKRSICGSIILTEEQQKIIDDNKRKMDEIIAEINKSINEKLKDIPRKCHSVKIELTYGGKVVKTLKYIINHDDERK